MVFVNDVLWIFCFQDTVCERWETFRTSKIGVQYISLDKIGVKKDKIFVAVIKYVIRLYFLHVKTRI